MINLSVSDSIITFSFSGNSGYLQNGTIEVPVNSLSLFVDASDMIVFKKAESNDVFIAALASDFGKTKEELISYFKENMVGSTGGGGSTADTAALKGVIDRSLTEIDIPSGITSIGDYAFYHCYDLTAVTIPNSVTSLSDWSFCYCSGLTSVIIPDSVTSINDNAFNNCRNLASITIGSGVTTIGKSVFLNNYNLTSVSIPDNVTSLGQQAFSYCSGLTSVTIGTGATSIGQSAFSNCRNLASITIPDSVTSIGQSAFNNCSSLTSCTIGSGVTSIGSGVFYGCNYLMGVIIEATTPPTLGNNALTGYYPICVPCNSVNTYKAASGWSSYASRIQAIPNSCVTPKWIATYTGGTTSSAQCDSTSAITSNEITLTNLASVEIGDCVTTIGNHAFDGCTSLTNCTIGSGVTSIGEEAFYDCTSLTSIYIPNSVTSIGEGAFGWCIGLTSCTIGSGVTSIGDNAFRSCSSLTSLTCLSTTPPTLDYFAFRDTNNCPIYVPAASVSAYQTAWSDYASRIQAIPS